MNGHVTNWTKFEESIKNLEWPTRWFDQVTADEQPWLYYMSSEYVSHCLEVVEGIMEAVSEHIAAQGLDFWWRSRDCG